MFWHTKTLEARFFLNFSHAFLDIKFLFLPCVKILVLLQRTIYVNVERWSCGTRAAVQIVKLQFIPILLKTDRVSGLFVLKYMYSLSTLHVRHWYVFINFWGKCWFSNFFFFLRYLVFLGIIKFSQSWQTQKYCLVILGIFCTNYFYLVNNLSVKTLAIKLGPVLFLYNLQMMCMDFFFVCINLLSTILSSL
jgi:hypothetical protein